MTACSVSTFRSSRLQQGSQFVHVLVGIGVVICLDYAPPAFGQIPTESSKPDPKSLEFFESKVRPILVTRCHECHAAEKQKGGLRLDSGEALLKGGDSGAAVVPGKPDESLLLTAIGYRGDIKMPPKSKLPQPEIAILTEWVQRGAPWPRESLEAAASENKSADWTPEQKSFWAFQPIQSPAVPDVTNAGWCLSEIDRFILAELERNGLSPAAPADKRTLIRRLTFDLTGLPPTPEAIADFLADDSPDAFARVVDRLLASPRYGERWGRFWLDVARYADSNGLDENLAYANAFRYRDYVVAAFNADKPYDLFVHEQIAGDLMPRPASEQQRQERLVATGFLSLGAKMLAEDDPVKMQMDIVDEQVDTVGRTFLGLTLGCARCHDHKFDPLSIEDYYSLAGIFKSTRTMDTFSVVAVWHERKLATEEELRQEKSQRDVIAARNGELGKLRAEAGEQLLREERRHAGDYLQAVWDRQQQSERLAAITPLEKDDEPLNRPGAILREAEEYDRGNVLKDFQSYGKSIGVLVNQGELPNFTEYDLTIPETKVYLVAVRLAAADGRPSQLLVDGAVVKSDAAAIKTGSWTPESQTWAIETFVTLAAGKHTLRLERNGPFPHIDKLLLAPTDLPVRTSQAGEFQPKPEFVKQWAEYLEKAAEGNPVWNTWREAIALSKTQAANDLNSRISARIRGPEAVALRYQQLFGEALDAWHSLRQSQPMAEGLPDAVQEAFRKILFDAAGPFALPETVETHFSSETQTKLQQLRTEIASFEKSLPQYPQAMAVSDDKPQNLRIHLRGNHVTLGKEVPRQFLRIVSGDRQTPIGPDRSGRLELAAWLTRPDHPLTARVMVNRIWQGHFGEGLVRSPDNFGRLGERPTHPKLLDWLAREFVDSGWSIKSLHRKILLSATWQMSTQPNPQAAAADPENRLLWRMNRRRLEAEAIRDAMLAVAGTLDPTMGGSQLPTPNRQYVTSTASVNPVAYAGTRRSVYLPVVRSALYEVLQAFDFADPSTQNGKRDVTTVAPQALFMMNSSFVAEQSQALAARLLSRAELSESDRIRAAWELALGEIPAADVMIRAEAFLARHVASSRARNVAAAEARRRAWQSLCRTLLATNEFVYVD